jgi:hypothetical protein
MPPQGEPIIIQGRIGDIPNQVQHFGPLSSTFSWIQLSHRSSGIDVIPEVVVMVLEESLTEVLAEII